MKTRHVWYAGLVMCAVLFALARWDIFEHFEAKRSLAGYADRAAVVAGTVAGDPDRRATSLRVTLKVATINGQAASGNLLAMLPRETEVGYGDQIEVRGVIELPEAFETESGRVFDYPGYLRVRGISVVMQRTVLREHEPAGMTLLGPLFALKHSFEHSLEQTMGEPEVSLLEGMLLGERGGLSQDLLQVFVIAGLIHIVVLSGSNIALVAEGIFRLLGAVPRLPRRALYVAGFLAIVCFALMAGGGAATVRAVIMGSIAILARYLRRPQAALRALAVASITMIIWNPLVLWLDTGFILSVLATFGLITLAPYVETKLIRLPAWKTFNIRSIVATTLAVEVFILPALLYTSGVLSFVSVPINASVLPLVPLVMFFGFVAGVLGFLHPLLAFVPAVLAQFLLQLILWIAETAARLPFASVLVVPFPWWIAALVYVPLTAWAISVYRRSASPEPTN
ncbi:MAG: hypothetical protein JWL87_651 [Candidatus Adlerbacteria bacterium]|nr:hypothetical protein [Candidatus Adlerbacteria bacterium]